MPRIRVEEATTKDQREIAMGIWRAANSARRRPAGAVRAGRVRDKLEHAELLLIGWYGDRAAGMLVAEQFIDVVPEPGTAHISMVFVDPAVWGCGVGTKLLQDLQQRSWQGLSVWTRTDNRRARRLYAGAGFADSGNRAHLQDGDVIMQFRWPSAQPRRSDGQAQQRPA